jgi:hypothetical protein
VHNIRIERLWCDVTRGFGLKWKNFFSGLEFSGYLEVDRDAHIWLLQHLFLPAINVDAQEWAEAWNAHNIRSDSERERSPRDMFFFGMIQEGSRGLHISEESDHSEDIEDLAQYGVDWEALGDDDLLEHHDHHNPLTDEEVSQNPFLTHQPHRLSSVEVLEPSCPFSIEQVQFLDDELASLPFYHSRSMVDHRQLWIHALEICSIM